MRLTFRVILAAVAILIVSTITVGQESCLTDGNYCNTDADCCPGNGCYRCDSRTLDGYARISLEIR
ncbi:hypothetical protein BDR07DRAFT_1427070 [Suillus spraguei]|nr:hypothetical protein BDR07DRAFT_1427070 [Suillus spraguei]